MRCYDDGVCFYGDGLCVTMLNGMCVSMLTFCVLLRHTFMCCCNEVLCVAITVMCLCVVGICAAHVLSISCLHPLSGKPIVLK